MNDKIVSSHNEEFYSINLFTILRLKVVLGFKKRRPTLLQETHESNYHITDWSINWIAGTGPNCLYTIISVGLDSK